MPPAQLTFPRLLIPRPVIVEDVREILTVECELRAIDIVDIALSVTSGAIVRHDGGRCLDRAAPCIAARERAGVLVVEDDAAGFPEEGVGGAIAVARGDEVVDGVLRAGERCVLTNRLVQSAAAPLVRIESVHDVPDDFLLFRHPLSLPSVLDVPAACAAVYGGILLMIFSC